MDPPDPDEARPVNDVPTVHCSRCDQEWDLAFELEALSAGNRAVEQFALDHERHTGHFPDDVTPWIADCRRCPDGEQYLSEAPARRWAVAHARHTNHAVELRSDARDTQELIEEAVPEYRRD